MARAGLTAGSGASRPTSLPHGADVFADGVVNPIHLEAGFGWQASPRGHRKQARRVAVRLHPQFAASLGEEDVCRLDGRVVGVEVCQVLDVGELGIGVAVGVGGGGGRLRYPDRGCGACQAPVGTAARATNSGLPPRSDREGSSAATSGRGLRIGDAVRPTLAPSQSNCTGVLHSKRASN